MTNSKTQIANRIQIFQCKYQNILPLGIYILLGIWVLGFGISTSAALGPIVPCTGLNCSWCDLLRLGKNIIDFLMYAIFPIATVMIIWGGFLILISGGSIDRAQRGRKALTAAIAGLLIALLAWIILDTIIKIVAPNFQAASFGPWNQLQCQ